MPTAVQYLRESDPNLQVLGAAYIQHECYNNNDAKQEVAQCRTSAKTPRLAVPTWFLSEILSALLTFHTTGVV